MINKLLFKLTARLPCRLIPLETGPYLERYYVGQLFGATFYLHRFVSSDRERHMHNHPWGWGRALVLCGGYIEESVVDLCPDAKEFGAVLKRRWVRWWNRVDGNHFHRISNAEPGTWTLFFHGPRVDIDGNPTAGRRGADRLKGWGFLEEGTTDSLLPATVFRSYPSTALAWWAGAPKGGEAKRVPL